MAVVGGVGCGGNVCLQRPLEYSSNLFGFHNNQLTTARACSSMACSPQSTSKPTIKISSSSSPLSKVSLQPFRKEELEKKTKKENELMYEKIDEWMRNSVVDIVKKLPESPLLVQVYSDNGKTRTKAEKAEEDNWVLVKQRWEKGESPMPDGLIFVEQLQDDDGDEKEKSQEVSRAWGIVVQGKGEECGPPACYLLKTSKVGSGLGLRCTHFCLVKVSSFRENAFSQLKNCWLLQAN